MTANTQKVDAVKINMFINELSFKKGAFTAQIEPHRCSKVDWYQLGHDRDSWPVDDTYTGDSNYGVLFGPARRGD